ncbi:hypothetical protein QU481_18020 [Crenobacter sp. SG2303]|uniref:Surface-adhesin protein E-like domain-containing protein n=1 Tax=Crenobacter oryzisoli TaxID=3056844 RepID=A0ABT7XSH9_9NEIS|nr:MULTISPECIES: surface-adhesin E family protein [unclassified Crenobacter]MDN0076757.1 hypothetical protein [Crenobacter sp. SG2303]MDN0085042.1 hypothetical protein [Crenobacter sp. SG2305]
MSKRYLALALVAGVLAGCATGPTTKTTLPTRPSKAPVDANADWQNLGVSPNGNILNEIDKLSIKHQGNLVSFRDKKTIFNPKKENFLSTPVHKYSINQWQIDCQSHTYRLSSMTLYDEGNRPIASFTYNADQIKPAPVVQNSASYQQMLFVCGSQGI